MINSLQKNSLDTVNADNQSRIAGQSGFVGDEPFHAAGWRGRTRGPWRSLLSDQEPLTFFMSQKHEQVHQRPMSRTWRVDRPEGSVYVKHVTTSTRDGVKAGRWEAVIKLQLLPSVAMRTWRISQRMASVGVRVPAMVLAARRRRGWHCEELIVTQEAVGDSLTQVLSDSRESTDVRAIFEMAGRRVAHLHDCGFTHGHLVPGHLVVTQDREDIMFLDNDENRWRPGKIRLSGRRRNITQLMKRLIGDDRLATDAASCFFEAYCEAAQLSQTQRRYCIGRVLTQASCGETRGAIDTPGLV